MGSDVCEVIGRRVGVEQLCGGLERKLGTIYVTDAQCVVRMRGIHVATSCC